MPNAVLSSRCEVPWCSLRRQKEGNMKTENRKASYRRVVTEEQGKSVIQSDELLQASPAVLPTDGTAGNRWAVVLVGGGGTPFPRLISQIAGGPRPKKFWFFFRGESHLYQTMEPPSIAFLVY